MINIVELDEVLLQLGLSVTVTEEERTIASKTHLAAEGAVRRFLGYDPCRVERTEYYPQRDLSQSGLGIWEVSDTQAYIRHLSEAVYDELQLRHIPIRSISSLRVDYDGRFGTRSGSFPASSAWTEGDDYWPVYDMLDSVGARVCNDGILRSQGRWPDVPGTIKIVYTAGYSASELNGEDSVIDATPIKDAVVDEAVRRFIKIWSRKKKSLAGFAGPLASESLGEYSYSVDTSARDAIINNKGELAAETMASLQTFVNYGLRIAI